LPRLTLAAFALGLLNGSILIALALRDPPAALALLVLAGIAGMIVVIARPVPPTVKEVFAFATGTALALSSPPQAITVPVAIAAQLGAGLAAVAALSLVALAATKAEHDWQRIGLRIAGSWIAASAILVLALRLLR